MLAKSHLRIARPSNDLASLEHFYGGILGFEVVGSFVDHEGFDGIMLGHPNCSYHLEFTTHADHPAPPAPSQEHLLVFYIPEKEVWEATIQKLEALGLDPVVSLNPYWDRSGRTYEDPDGYRIVIQHGSWPVQSST